MSGGYDLERFVAAQEAGFPRALAELRQGRKRSHWMWFIFPQLAGLGQSAMARHYAIGSLSHARAYLAHPVLGPRLRQATRAALDSGVDDPHALLGSPDDMKMRSSLTLFALADPHEPVFRQALDRFYDGAMDPRTLALLGLSHDG
jgi:uncharacterized protein (DUF1810 family)